MRHCCSAALQIKSNSSSLSLILTKFIRLRFTIRDICQFPFILIGAVTKRAVPYLRYDTAQRMARRLALCHRGMSYVPYVPYDSHANCVAAKTAWQNDGIVIGGIVCPISLNISMVCMARMTTLCATEGFLCHTSKPTYGTGVAQASHPSNLSGSDSTHHDTHPSHS